MRKFGVVFCVLLTAAVAMVAVYHFTGPAQTPAVGKDTASAPASQAAQQPATRPAKAVVVIVKGTDPKKMMQEAMRLLGGLDGVVGKAKTVTLKPNLTGVKGGSPRGVSTSGEVMEALVEEIQKVSKAKLTIAEGAGKDFDLMTRLTGMDKLAQTHDVELLNTADPKTPRTKVNLPDGRAYKSYEYPKAALDADVFIDVPVMKTHQLAGITVGFKNLYGYLPGNRMVYHDRCWDVLVDLVKIRRPDLVVVDATYTMEGQGPLWGNVLKHDLLIVGTDIVAVDTVCGAVMGQPIERIPYTNEAARLGMGVADLKDIEIRGQKIADVKKDYAMARWHVSLELPRTDKLLARLDKLCDDGKSVWPKGNGVTYEFKSENLVPDLKRYPLREKVGFSVKADNGEKTVEFGVRYTVLYDENRQAAEDEMRAWIRKNLSDVTDKEPVTVPMGGEWNGRKE